MAQLDPAVPSIARVYDYVLGGKDNYAADRALAGASASRTGSSPGSPRPSTWPGRPA